MDRRELLRFRPVCLNWLIILLVTLELFIAFIDGVELSWFGAESLIIRGQS